MKRVTGIGGIFFKSEDPEKLKNWYNKHLGIEVDQYGSMFRLGGEGAPHLLQWSVFKSDTDYMAPSSAPFMINYCVEDMEKLVEVLKEEGVEVVDDIAVYEYGKFVHIMDPDGNKVELWEPPKNVENAFDA